MRTMLRSKVTLLFLTLTMLLAVSVVAFAIDTLSPDADTLNANGGPEPIANLGNVPAGATLTRNVDFYLVCGDGGGQARHFDSTDSATLTFAKPNSTIPAGGDLAATDTSINGPVSPTDWPADNVNCSQAGSPSPVKVGTSAVTITAPSTSGTHNYTVHYNVSRASGTETPELSSAFVAAHFFLTVQQQPQTITFDQPAPKTYGVADFDPGATASSGLAVSYSSSTPSVCTIVSGKVHVVSASDCKVTASQAGNSNYSAATSVERTIVINKAPLTVTADPQTKTYGQADPNFTFQYSGFVNNEGAGVIDTAPTCSVPVAHTNTGSYDITCSGGLDNNYSFKYVDGTLTVNQKAATVTADNKSKTYGEDDPAFTFQTTGVLSGDTLTGVSCGVSGAHTDVGSYDITCSGNTNNNYNVTYNKGTLTVNPATLTVTAENKSREYGEANPALTATITGVKLSDTQASAVSGSPDLSTTATAASNVGSYPIVASQGSLSAANYNFDFVNGTLQVTKAPITIEANDVSRYYGQANNLTYSIVSGSFKYNDLANNDVTVNLSTTATATSQAGDYPITVSLGGPKAGNYAFTGQPGTLTITAWTNQGFFSPVDYGTMQNTVKGGSTVPLKFQVFQGTQQLTSTSIVSGLKPTVTNCSTGLPIDAIEELATGGTSLRYDTTSAQFIFNWQTPKKPGTCYNVTVQMVDGSSIPVAKFWLK